MKSNCAAGSSIAWRGCSTPSRKVQGSNPNVRGLPVDALEQSFPLYKTSFRFISGLCHLTTASLTNVSTVWNLQKDFPVFLFQNVNNPFSSGICASVSALKITQYKYFTKCLPTKEQSAVFLWLTFMAGWLVKCSQAESAQQSDSDPFCLMDVWVEWGSRQVLSSDDLHLNPLQKAFAKQWIVSNLIHGSMEENISLL